MRDQVRELANRVDRLTIQRRDPEAFFVERAAIVGDLRRLARMMGRAGSACQLSELRG
jgi:hypothetical protein